MSAKDKLIAQLNMKDKVIAKLREEVAELEDLLARYEETEEEEDVLEAQADNQGSPGYVIVVFGKPAKVYVGKDGKPFPTEYEALGQKKGLYESQHAVVVPVEAVV